MDEVGKILPAVFKRHVQRLEPPVVEILAPLWSRVAGKAMANQCRPASFSGGTLTIITESESWNLQLQQMAEEIRAEINSFLGGPVVKRLRVRQVLNLDAGEMASPQHGKVSREWTDGAANPSSGIACEVDRTLQKRLLHGGGKVH